MHDFTTTTVNRHSSLEEREVALIQIYGQVLERQPYAAERKSIAALEKDFLKDKIGVRRFLKGLGCSDLYLNEFYHRYSNMKFLDLCFKHFLGRAIANRDEMQLYGNILATQGATGLITAVLDSEEYRKVFGCFTVPHPQELKYYQSPEAFLESKFINEEHTGQRGWTIPTLYWRQLGLTCRNGVCRHPDPSEMTASAPTDTKTSVDIEALLNTLKTSDITRAKALIANLSPQQREELLLALH